MATIFMLIASFDKWAQRASSTIASGHVFESAALLQDWLELHSKPSGEPCNWFALHPPL